MAGEEAGGQEAEPAEERRGLIEVEMAAEEVAEQAGEGVVEEDEAVVAEGVRGQAEDDQAGGIEGLELRIGEGVLAELDVGIPGREGGGEELGGEAGLVGVATAEEPDGKIEAGGMKEPGGEKIQEKGNQGGAFHELNVATVRTM